MFKCFNLLPNNEKKDPRRIVTNETRLVIWEAIIVEYGKQTKTLQVEITRIIPLFSVLLNFTSTLDL